jgi:hypothetical protein
MVLQELEGFSIATALDFIMGYYSIRLDPDASKICTIIFPWENIPTSDYQWVLQVLQTFSKGTRLDQSRNFGKTTSAESLNACVLSILAQGWLWDWSLLSSIHGVGGMSHEAVLWISSSWRCFSLGKLHGPTGRCWFLWCQLPIPGSGVFSVTTQPSSPSLWLCHGSGLISSSLDGVSHY